MSLASGGIGLLLLILWNTASAYFPRVTVGVIVGKNDNEYLSGIKYALRLHELNISAPFRVHLLVETIDDDDIYQMDRAVCSILSQGVLAIMAPTSSSTFSTLASYSNNFHVPFISPSLPIIPPEKASEYGVSIMPSSVRASLDIIRHNEWHSVLYLYDTEDGPESFNRLMLLAADVHYINVLGIHRITSAEDAVIYMRKIGFANRGDKQVVLNTDAKLVYEIIKSFQHDVHIRKTNYNFLSMKPVLDSFWEDHTVEFQGVNLTGFRLINPENERYRQFKYGWFNTNPNSKAGPVMKNLSLNAVLGYDGTLLLLGTIDLLLRKYYESLRKGRPTQFILNGTQNRCFESQGGIPYWKYGYNVSHYMKYGAVNTGLTGSMYFDSDGMRQNYLLEIIKTLPSGYTKVASWSDTGGFRSIRSDNTRLQTLSSQLKNGTLIVTSILSEPYLMIKGGTGSRLSGNDRYEGYCKDLADTLTQELKLSYEFRLVADGRYGSLTDSNKWSGMIGEVINRNADVAIAPLTVTSSRSNVVQFSQPFQTVGISLMMKKAGTRDVSPLSTSPFFFLYVFTKEVWICIIVAYAVITALLFAVTKYTTGPDRARSNDHKKQNSVCSTLWFTMGTFLLRETGIHPKSIASRVLSCTWWAFTLAVISLYIANAATILVAHRIGSDSGTNNAVLSARGILSVLEEALASGTLQLGCIVGGSTHAFFKNAQLDLYKRIWDHMEQHPENYFRTTAEAVERVRKSNGKYAALVESTLNEYISHREPCDTLMVSGTLDTKGYAVATAKGSPLSDSINEVLSRLQESGKLNQLYDKWWVRTSECAHRYSRSVDEMYHDSMTIWEISGIFYFLLIGVAVVIAITAAEYMYCARHNGGRRNKSPSDETST